MDLKICFSSRCLLLCEAVQAAKPDGTATEPVDTKTSFVRATVGRELHCKNIKQQKQNKSESTKKERGEESKQRQVGPKAQLGGA